MEVAKHPSMYTWLGTLLTPLCRIALRIHISTDLYLYMYTSKFFRHSIPPISGDQWNRYQLFNHLPMTMDLCPFTCSLEFPSGIYERSLHINEHLEGCMKSIIPPAVWDDINKDDYGQRNFEIKPRIDVEKSLEKYTCWYIH